MTSERPDDILDRSSAPSVLDLLRQINEGTLDAQSMSRPDRLRCVEHLTAEGYSLSDIADITRVSDRTIARDRKEIRQANALSAGPDLLPEMAGQLLREAEQITGRIRRLTRERSTPPAVKLDGERTTWVILRELIETLQKLGYLPTAPHEFRGELVHRHDALPSGLQMRKEAARIEVVLRQFGTEEERSEIAEVQKQVEPLAINEQLGAIRDRLPPEAVTILDADTASDTNRAADDIGGDITKELRNVTDDEREPDEA